METTETAPAHAWGLQPPADRKVSWGARAIYKLRYVPEARERVRTKTGKVQNRKVRGTGCYVADIDLLGDRQCMVGPEADRKALSKWLNTKGLKALNKLCVASSLGGDEDRTVRIDGDSKTASYVLQASPRASYGYLYIGCWSV